jgi:(2R)-3-sulfolactate dehydrogenase (NADP+)
MPAISPMPSSIPSSGSIGCGQFFIAIEPRAFSGGAFARQVAALARSISDQEGARLPNARRQANQKRLAKDGLPIARALYERLKGFAGARPRNP